MFETSELIQQYGIQWEMEIKDRLAFALLELEKRKPYILLTPNEKETLLVHSYIR